MREREEWIGGWESRREEEIECERLKERCDRGEKEEQSERKERAERK